MNRLDVAGTHGCPGGTECTAFPRAPVRSGDTQSPGAPRAGGSANTRPRRDVLPAPPRCPFAGFLQMPSPSLALCVHLASWLSSALEPTPPAGATPQKDLLAQADFPERIWERVSTS